MKTVTVVARIRGASLLSAATAVAIALSQATPAHDSDAGQNDALSVRLAQNGAAKTVEFQIAAQPISDALTELGQQSGLTIIIETKISKDVKAQALTGRYTPEEALKKLLAPAGLKAEYLDSKTVAVRLASEGVSTSPDPLLHTANGEDEVVLQEVLVTGTHIRGAAPVGSRVIEITRADVDKAGYTSTSQIIENLPQNFSGGGPQVGPNAQGAYALEFSARTGTSTPSLRGLGDATLTLFDGHRLSHTGSANGSDISSIPLAAIERVEVLPDGASSIYGSDAIAGVINVVLRKDYDGIEASADMTEPTRSGGGQQQTYSLLAGTHWTGGNVLASYSGDNQDALLTRDRSFSNASTDPTSLFPSSHSNAFTVYLDQALGAGLELHLDGLYNSKTNNSYLSVSFPDFAFSQYGPGTTKTYALNAGLTSHLGDSWLLGVDANISEDKRGTTEGQIADGVNSILVTTKTTDREYGIEVHGDGPVARWAPGDIKGAFGGGVRRETYELFTAVPGRAPRDLPAHRVDSYLYAELEVPFVSPEAARAGLESFALSLSGRYDRYSDFGSTTNPKIGFRYGVIRDVHLSGSYGRSFRAPLLLDLSAPQQGFLFYGSDARFPTGSAPALELSGGNPLLRPETSTSWSATIDYTPATVAGLTVSASWFSYNFKNKIVSPVNADVLSVPLSDPSIEPFTTFFPTPVQIQQATRDLIAVSSAAGPGVTVNDVQAIVEDRYQNVAAWTARGVDLLGAYRVDVGRGALDFSFNGTMLTVKELPLPGVPEQTLSGAVFGPAKWRARSGLTWSDPHWSVSGFVNYVSGETDIYSLVPVKVGAFVTVDTQIAYKFTGPSSWRLSWLSGTRISLSARNILDRNPPRLSYESTVNPGLGYDPTNASPFGRLLTLRISKAWAGR